MFTLLQIKLFHKFVLLGHCKKNEIQVVIVKLLLWNKNDNKK